MTDLRGFGTAHDTMTKALGLDDFMMTDGEGNTVPDRTPDATDGDIEARVAAALHDCKAVGGPWMPCEARGECDCRPMARHLLAALAADSLQYERDRADKAEAIARELESWIAAHSGHHMRYVPPEYEPGAVVCDDCDDNNLARFDAESVRP